MASDPSMNEDLSNESVPALRTHLRWVGRQISDAKKKLKKGSKASEIAKLSAKERLPKYQQWERDIQAELRKRKK